MDFCTATWPLRCLQKYCGCLIIACPDDEPYRAANFCRNLQTLQLPAQRVPLLAARVTNLETERPAQRTTRERLAAGVKTAAVRLIRAWSRDGLQTLGMMRTWPVLIALALVMPFTSAMNLNSEPCP